MNKNIEKEFLALIEKSIAGIEYPAVAPGLFKPIKYAMASGGKRIRPLLTLAAAQAFGLDPQLAIRQALAIELFHNFTLLHDDVMDRSDRRRDRPTVWRKYGEVQAILSGDALLTLATQYAADCPADKLSDILSLFNRTAMEVYEGQQYDTEFERLPKVSVTRYLEMIRLKTSVLLGCAARIGAILAGADAAAQQAMYDYAINMGVAFQLRDDWLDTYGDPRVFGKNIGGDIVNRKKTWLFITANAEAGDELREALSESRSRTALVGRVKKVYDKLDLSKRCEALVDRYYKKAIAALKACNLDEESEAWFAELAYKMCVRQK